MAIKVYRKANGVSRIIRADHKGGTRSAEWAKLRDEVRARDGDRCVRCGRTRKELNALGIALETNHVNLAGRGGTDSRRNVQCECTLCHEKNPKHDHLRKRRKIKAARAKERIADKHKLLGKVNANKTKRPGSG